ncbi:MAG: amidohydrolase [Clostridiales bacterium]|nr:amidohydrolase [Clostridiales bacterium]
MMEYYVTVTDKTVTEISERRPQGQFDRQIEGRGKLLAAGLYNAHCHSPMTLFRGYGEDLPLDRWLSERIFPAEELLTDESVRAGSMLAIAEMLKNGIVSFTDMYSLCEATAYCVIESGIKANIGRAILSFNPDVDMSVDARMRELIALADAYHGAADGRVRIDMAIHAEYTNNAKSVAYVAEYAAKGGYGIQLHLSETEKEHNECIARHNMTPARFFHSLGVFDSPVSAAHCVWVSDEDIALMAECGVTAVHNPSSNLKLGSGVMPLRKMLDSGVNVALGTDGAASNNTLDIFKEMHLAAILHKGISRQPGITKAPEIWRLATENGAISQQRPDSGTLRVGGIADLILIDLEALNNLPSYDFYSTLVYSAGASDVVLTMVDGRILYEKGEFKTIDIEKVKYNFGKIMARYYDGMDNPPAVLTFSDKK